MTKITEYPEGFDIDALREHWLEVGRSTEPCDRPKMEAAVRKIYEFCGFKQPQAFIWSRSPREAALAKIECDTGKKPSVNDLKKSIWDTLGGYSWYTTGSMGTTSLWAYYDAGRQCGVDYGDKLNEILDACLDLTGAGFWFAFENVVFMCEKPTELNLDAQGRLHNESGPSMLFGDGYSLWSIHGTTVPREIVEHPEQITTEAIMKESNSEVRRIMCEIMGWDRFVSEAGLTLVDECDDPGNSPHTLKLYDTPEQVFDAPVRLLITTNGTPKPNGIVPNYGLTVPIEIESALEAGAWLCEVPVEQYSQLQRRT